MEMKIPSGAGTTPVSVEIIPNKIWHSNAKLETFDRNNMEFKCRFVALANIQLRSIRGYTKFPIKARRFGHSVLTVWENVRQSPIQAIENRVQLTNNVWQRPIWMHSERTVMHWNAWGRTKTHRSIRKHTGKTNNVRQILYWEPDKCTNE